MSVFSSVAAGAYVCPQSCFCNETVVRCVGFIPAVIPDYVKEVELVDLKQNDFFDGTFCDSGWNSVTNLSIVCKQKCEKEFHTIGDNVFRCLDTLNVCPYIYMYWNSSAIKHWLAFQSYRYWIFPNVTCSHRWE